MKRFYVLNNRDAAFSYVFALKRAGYEETTIQKADFILTDFERPIIKQMRANRPLFFYPHTPYSWFVWDGLSSTHKASCNFVYGENAKLGLTSLGYVDRIEVCGFSRCATLPFRPSIGRRLLFAPAHPLMNGRYPREEDYQVHRSAFDWVIKYKEYFDSVTVRIFGTIEQNGFYKADGIHFENAATTTRYTTALTVQNSIESIERHDLIISCNTFGYLSLARGKPTILYGNTLPRTREGDAKNYHLYKHLIDFPCPLESLTINEIIKAGSIISPVVAEWKSKTIGQNFDAEKFLSVIKDYV